MNKKILIACGFISASFAALIIANSGPSEREKVLFDSLKEQGAIVEEKVMAISDNERIEKSLLNEYLQATESGLKEELAKTNALGEKISERAELVNQLENEVLVYEEKTKELEKLNSAKLLNKETKLVGNEYIQSIRNSIDDYNELVELYSDAIELEKVFYESLGEKDEEILLSQLEEVNGAYLEIKGLEEEYQKHIDELKKYRATYVQQFGYKEN